jgi:hypothetical protein
MMKKNFAELKGGWALLGAGLGSIYIANYVLDAPEIGMAVVVGAIALSASAWIIMRNPVDQNFLLKLFLAAAAVRWIVGYLIYYKGLQSFFGPDAETYDAFGYTICKGWMGLVDARSEWFERVTSPRVSGWGMYYYVAAVYYLIGRNSLALQFINCALGAMSCVLVHRISMLIYPSLRAARAAAIMMAFAPSLIIWSSQLLKDGPITTCILLSALFTLKLNRGFELKSFIFLILSLLALFSLRHYVAYIVFIAIAGTLILSQKEWSPARLIYAGLTLVAIGVTLAYFGAGEALSTIDLKRIQMFREWSSNVAESTFGANVDITDTEAVIEYLPIGLIYVLFAPFPWMIKNLRQLIALPELLLWWILTPMMLRGYWFMVRKRLRESFTACTLLLGLVLTHALYQSNVGTAYRHRAQIYGFFFIFISIGLELRRMAKLKLRLSSWQPKPFVPAPMARPQK